MNVKRRFSSFSVSIFSLAIVSLLLLLYSYQGICQTGICTPEKLNELRLLAQSLDARTPKSAIELSSCAEYRDEALLWAAFYQKQMGAYEKIAQPLETIENPSTTASRFQVFGNASQGAYKTLESLIKEEKSGYAGDAEAHLILARALVRDRRTADGRVQYERYLTLKPDDTDVRIEYAYSYLWDDQWKKAESTLNLIATMNLTSAQQKSVQRGLDMAKVIHARIGEQSSYEQMPAVPFFFGRNWSSFKGFSRQTLSSGYHAPTYSIDAGIMSLNSDDTSTGQAAVELTGTKNFSIGKSSDLFAKLGWWQATESNFIFNLTYAKSFPSGFRPLAGIETEPLAKFAPIPVKYSGWSRSSLFAGLHYKDRFEYRFYATTVTANGNFSKHSLLIQFPAFKNFIDGKFKVRLLAESLSAQQYSPYLYSPRESNVVLPGVRYQTKLDDNSDLDVGFDYGFVGERLNPGNPSGTQSLSGNSSGTITSYSAHYKTEVTNELIAEARFKFDRTSGPNDSVTYQAGELLFGALWYFDRPQRLEEARQ